MEDQDILGDLAALKIKTGRVTVQVLGGEKLKTYYVKTPKHGYGHKKPPEKKASLVKATVLKTNCVLRLGDKRMRSLAAKGDAPTWEIEKLEVDIDEEDRTGWGIFLRVHNCDEDIQESIKELKGAAALPDELGHTTIKLQDVVLSVLVDSEVIETFPLASPITGRPGKVTLHVLYQTNIVLPPLAYEEFLVLLEEKNFLFTQLLASHGASTFPLLLPCLMSVFCVRGSLIRFMKAMVKEHVKEHVETYEGEDAFRADSPCSSLVERFMRLSCKRYLQNVLRPFLDTILKEDLNCEILPAKLGNHPEKAEEHMKDLMRYCDMIAKAIFQSIDNVPAFVREMFSFITLSIQQHISTDPSASRTAISSFFFLRLYSPAIANPTDFGIISEHLKTSRLSQTCLYLAKFLQTLASGASFSGREESMLPLIEIVDSNKESMVKFLESLARAPPNSTQRVGLKRQRIQSMSLPKTDTAQAILTIPKVRERAESVAVTMSTPIHRTKKPSPTMISSSPTKHSLPMPSSPPTTMTASAQSNNRASSQSPRKAKVPKLPEDSVASGVLVRETSISPITSSRNSTPRRKVSRSCSRSSKSPRVNHSSTTPPPDVIRRSAPDTTTPPTSASVTPITGSSNSTPHTTSASPTGGVTAVPSFATTSSSPTAPLTLEIMTTEPAEDTPSQTKTTFEAEKLAFPPEEVLIHPSASPTQPRQRSHFGRRSRDDNDISQRRSSMTTMTAEPLTSLRTSGNAVHLYRTSGEFRDFKLRRTSSSSLVPIPTPESGFKVHDPEKIAYVFRAFYSYHILLNDRAIACQDLELAEKASKILEEIKYKETLLQQGGLKISQSTGTLRGNHLEDGEGSKGSSPTAGSSPESPRGMRSSGSDKREREKSSQRRTSLSLTRRISTKSFTKPNTGPNPQILRRLQKRSSVSHFDSHELAKLRKDKETKDKDPK